MLTCNISQGVDEVLVKLEAASLQFRDLSVPPTLLQPGWNWLEADLWVHRMIAKNFYPMNLKENVVPGSDGELRLAEVGAEADSCTAVVAGAGTVVALGPTRYSQEKWKVGDRVAGQFSQLHQSGMISSQSFCSCGRADVLKRQGKSSPPKS